MNPPSFFRWSYFSRTLMLAVLYALLAKTALAFFSENSVVSIVWPSSGLALAALLIGGKKYWPGVFLGAFAGNLIAGSPAWISACIAAGNTLEALIAVGLLTQVGRFDSRLTNLRDYLLLSVAGALGACASAAIGNITLLAAGVLTDSNLGQSLLQWWQGDLLGIVLMAPAILVWRTVPRAWFSQARLSETIACFGLAFLAGQIIFLGWLGNPLGVFSKAFLMFAFVTWSAVRFGRHGATLIIGMTAIQALLGALAGVGFFARDIAETGLSVYWIFMLELTVVGMSMALTIHERRVAESALREREEKLRAMFELSPLGMARNSMEGRYIEANQALLEMVGYSLAELNAMSYWDLTPGQYADDEARQLESLEHTGRYGPYEKEYVHRDGHRIPIRLNGVLITGSDGEKYIWSTVEDITERKHAEEKMQLAALVYQNSSEAMSVTEADNTIIAINPAFTKVTGYSPEEIIGKKPDLLRSGRHDTAFYDDMWLAINTTGHWQGEIWDRRKNGEVYAKLLTINTIFNGDGSVHRRVALFSDINEKKKSEEIVWRQANFDSLTGLPNRSMFNDRLEVEIKKSSRTGQPLALLFLDLDRFKEVNDTLGHAMGDVLLKDAAQRLLSCVRETDTVARFGGDEFTIILGELDGAINVERIAFAILRKLAEPFRLGNEIVYISASIGITFYPEDALAIDMLLKNADQAMYAAKQQGRNRFSYFTPALQATAIARMWLATELRSALAENQFRLVYQPIVEMATGITRKAEALIRWQHPTRGLINPAEFIPVAEETEIIIDIGEWVFRQAVRQVARCREIIDPDFQISINKSPVQFRSTKAALANWFDYLRAGGLSGQSIVVEITEGMLMEADAALNDKLIAFRDAGIQVALDDFGTGYSSLSYLKKFDIDYLKIDQSFVRNLAPDSDDLALCEAIIVMAHKLGMKVIAEGVETREQWDLLAAAGSDYAQGFLFARPMPPQEFEAFLADKMKRPRVC